MALGHRMAAAMDHHHDHLTPTPDDRHDQGTQWKTRTDRAITPAPTEIATSRASTIHKHKHTPNVNRWIQA